MNGRLWDATAGETIETAPLKRDLAVDLAIIGGGFTGCAAALEGASRGASVALLDANAIGHGGSGRNVGLVNAGLWLPPEEIVSLLGEVAGNRLIAVLAEAPSVVFGLVARHQIACEPQRAGTLHCAHAPAGLSDLESRFRQGNRHGALLRLLDAAETARRTGAEGLCGALFDPRAGTIQPLAYCRGLARAAVAAGASIFAPAPVSAMAREGEAWVLTSGAHTVRARALLVATNAYHEGLEGPHAPQFVPFSYSQFATRPLPDRLRGKILPGGEGCWDTARVMSSFRLDAAGRLVVGGVGNREGAAGAIHDHWARRKLRALFPEIGDIAFEHAWRGKIAMTRDHVPKIVAFGPDALSSYGYSGRGIGPGTVFGTAAAQALLTGETSGLPVAPVTHYAERFRGARAAYYEAGATLVHALARGGYPKRTQT